MSGPPIAEQALVELTHWLKRVAQYSAAHPACIDLGAKTHATLTRALAESSPMTIGVLKDDILIGESSATHPALRMRLGPHLHERGVILVRFSNGITQRELSDFVELLSLPAATIFDRGGLLRLSLDKAIARVQVEELAHDVTDEEREAQARRKRMREFFREMLRNLLAQRKTGRLGEHLRTLLEHPDIAVTFLEEDPAGIGEAVAGLALMTRQEAARTGEDFGPALREILLRLAPPSRGRVLLALPMLLGDFRQALTWALSFLTEAELARFALPALRGRTEDFDPVFYALAVAVPSDVRRRATMRRVACALFDLPSDDPTTAELWAALSRPVAEFDSFREERECLRAQSLRAFGARALIGALLAYGASSLDPSARTSLAPAPIAVPSLGPAPRLSLGSMPRAMAPSFAPQRTSSSIPPSMPPGLVGSMPPDRGGTAHFFDGARAAGSAVRAAARTGQLARICRTLPRVASVMAEEGASDAVLGIVRALSDAAKSDREGAALRAIGEIGASPAAMKILVNLEEAVNSLDGDELQEVLGALKLLVAQSPTAALDRLDASESRKMRRLLLDALSYAGVASLPLVRSRLLSTKWFVVRNAVVLVARCGGNATDLATVAHHDNEKVRLEVARALRSVPVDEAAMKVVVSYLIDPSLDVRQAALPLLRGEAVGPSSLATLEAYAGDDAQGEGERLRVVTALGRSKLDGAAEALYRLMHPRGLLERGATSNVREEAAIALFGSPAPRARSLFEEGLRSSTSRVRKACERAVGRPS